MHTAFPMMLTAFITIEVSMETRELPIERKSAAPALYTACLLYTSDEMHFITESRDAEYFASKIKDNGGVYFVPAFTGLGAPHWDMYARGAILGITRGTKREHIIRAAVESTAYQTKELPDAVAADTGIRVEDVYKRQDGGHRHHEPA